AHLRSTAIGVVHDHTRRSGLHEEDTVGTDTETAMAEPLYKRVVEGGAGIAQDNEIIAEPLPFLKMQPHRVHPASRIRASVGLIPLTSTSFPRLLAPVMIVTSPRRTPSACERSLMSSAFAAPSAGGAVSATSSEPSRAPRIAEREERGRTCTENRTAPARS